MKTMKAAILAAQGEPLVIDSVELPRDLLPGQALVKVHYTSVCGSQVAMIDGKRGKDPYLPHLLGHEGSGTVEAVGARCENGGARRSCRVALRDWGGDRIRNAQLPVEGKIPQRRLGNHL